MVVTPVNDLTTYIPSTTSSGMGISIRTISIPVEIIIVYNILCIRNVGSALGGRTPYVLCIYIPRAPISIYAGYRWPPVFDVKTDQTRSLTIELVYTYISPKSRRVSVKAISYIHPRYAKKWSSKNLRCRQKYIHLDLPSHHPTSSFFPAHSAWFPGRLFVYLPGKWGESPIIH